MLPRLLRAFAARYPRAVFIEIGSNDGEQHDHLRAHIVSRQWSGVMVEPVPYVFARLQANYGGNPRIALENAAISGRDGLLPFFHLRDAGEDERADLPDWYDGIGSFQRAAILSHAPQMPDIERRIVEQVVPTLRFDSLCARHGIERPDLVVIDTEGHDWEIVRNIDLAKQGPRLLIYEHFHLSAADRAVCRAHLDAAGYETEEEGFDTICLWPEKDRLSRLFNRLTPAVGGVAKYEEAS
jgi:FkbM family methyltransferase